MTMTQEEEAQASALIDALGGTGDVAALCKISAPSISGWRKRGIPHPWLMFFRERFPQHFDAEGNIAVAVDPGQSQ